MLKKIGLLVGALFLLTPQTVFAAEAQSSLANEAGWLTLLPPLVAIILAFITKNVLLSLFLGIFSGTIMIEMFGGANIISALTGGFLDLVQLILDSLADPWNAGIILQVLTIGGLIGLITKMGGARAVAEALAKKAKGPVSTQVITWVLGLLVFFDDYANSLIVGPIMRPVSDKMKISRERLAFVVDATAAPIAGIAVVSTWVGYEIGLINDAYASIGHDVNAYGIFLDTIPYRFYNILMLLFVLVTSLTLREFGSMRTAQMRARNEGKLIAEGSEVQAEEEEDEELPAAKEKATIWNALIPIGALIVFSFVGFYTNGRDIILNGDNQQLIQLMKDQPFSFTTFRETFGASDASIVLFQAALIASIIAIIMGVAQKLFRIGEALDIWIDGMKSLVITGAILLMAWSLSGVMTQLGTADFMVSLLGETMPAFLLPTVIFVFGAIISFATGTSYGTMGILMPLAIPLAAALQPENPEFAIMSAGAVLTGAIFGDHASPISDTTILSSMGAGSNHIDHVKTQLPYAVAVALVAILFGYIPAACGVPIMIILPVSAIATIAMIFILGKKVDTSEKLKGKAK
ncbi:Na+/H+ antiporter NhaC family protein [Pisciglobus halotolerans]|uniref:Na+/H+ antiporter NhaC n=1 Tax=Pisciglobus halotolerans TaxID=745365 RepID=A0A1I3CY26_9LACT|nr:Na+/H+ antiporter NhaC family protein [Pisciglobus halotolerans]SFH79424.1 Na+/H+ antiporter NhaC [Pisciglobus halotolerans]